MKNRRGGMLIFIIMFILIIAGSIIYVIYNELSAVDVSSNNKSSTSDGLNKSKDVNISLPSIENKSDVGGVNKTLSNDSFFDSDRVRWDHMPLRYKINNSKDCEGVPKNKTIEAMKIIENLTNGLITFIENYSNGVDIDITCVDGMALLNRTGIVCKNMTFDYQKNFINPEEEGFIGNSDYFISSKKVKQNDTDTVHEVCYVKDGKNIDGLKEARISVNGKIIEHASINIYKSDWIWKSCANVPAAEIHQIFHAMGFNHSDKPPYENLFGWSNLRMLEDVMFPYLYCKYQRSINNKYFSCLSYIYSKDKKDKNCSGVNFKY